MTKNHSSLRLLLLVCALMLAFGAAAGEAFTASSNGNVLVMADDHLRAGISGIVTDNSGDPVADAVVTFVDANGNEVASVTADSQGRWNAGRLLEGTYSVSAASNQKRVVSGQALTIFAGHDAMIRLSAQSGSASVEVCVFQDKNKNGEMGASESVLPGVLVELVCKDGGELQVLRSAETGSDTLTFNGLPAGSYYLRVTLPELYGYSKKTTKSSNLDLNIMSQTTDNTQVSPELTLKSGEKRECGVAAMPLSGTAGTIWLDVNGDGIQNNEELGLAGAKVEMAGIKNGLTYTCITDGTGYYRFTQLKPGSYALKVTLPDGYVFTRKAAGVSAPFNAEGESFGKASYNLLEPQMLENLNVGAMPCASLTVSCFTDNNHNGLQDEGDTALSGVRLEICPDDSSSPIQSVTSGRDGLATFTGLLNGTYRVNAALPDGSYCFTAVVENGSMFTDEGTIRSTLRGVGLGVGESHQLLLGAVKPGTITGMVYIDKNYSGTKEQDELTVRNVEVRLLNADGDKVAATTTNKNGQYTFTNVYPGTYQVAVTAKNKYAVSVTGHITSSYNGVGTTDLFTMDFAQKKTGLNAAFIRPCTVVARVWSDENDNGVLDPGEGGLTNATVILESAANRYEMNPARSGRVGFDCVVPGTYRMIVQLPDQDEFVGTIPEVFTLSADRHSASTAAFEVTTDEKVSIPAIGGISYTPVSGIFFIDTNANGVQDPGEAPLAGAQLSIVSDRTDLPMASQSITTGADGRFALQPLRPGDYTLTLILPDGWMISRTPNVTMPVPAETFSLTDSVHLGVGVNWSEQQLGVVHPATLSGLMWMDEDHSGTMSATEPGPAGRRLTVIDLRSGKPYVNLITQEDGTFSKTTMLPGEYRLVYQMDGFCQPVYGPDTNFTPYDADSVSYENIVLKGNDTVSGLKIGLDSFTTVGGFIWQDVNGTILPLSGRTVRLMDGTGAVIATTESGEDGRYAFDWLTAGFYCVDTTVPDDQFMVRYDDWRVTSGQCESAMSYVAGSYGRSDVFEVRMGRHLLEKGTGAVGYGDMGDMCWLDVNGNGLQDAGELGIPNVTIQLLEGDRVLAQTVTDQYGYYRFLHLYPGEYVLHVIYPAEVRPTAFRTDFAGVGSVMQESGIDSFPVHVTSNGHNFNCDVGFTLINPNVFPAGYGDIPTQRWK